MPRSTKLKYIVGDLLSQCPRCKVVRIKTGRYTIGHQASIVLFDHIPHEVCVSCGEKHVDMGITEPAL